MAQQISINTERVGSAVNRISTLMSDIQTRTNAAVEKLNEQNSATNGKWSLLVNLENKLIEEKQNIENIVAAQEDIKRGLNQFAEMAAEVNDGSAFA